MSNKNPTITDMSESTLENICVFLMILIILALLLPMTIMTAIIIILLEHVKINKTLLFILTLIICTIFVTLYPQSMQMVFINAYINLCNIISDLTISNILKCLLIDSFKFPVGSYICMMLIAILISIVIYEIYSYRKKLEKAGVKTFTTNVNHVADKRTVSKKNIKFTKELENMTFIGMDLNNNNVFTKDDAKHLFLCGTTGSGKTVALSNYIYSAVTKDYPAVIIDGKGDLGENSILQVTKELTAKYNRKLYVINMTNIEQSDKYNPFKNSTATICKDMLINMSDWSEEHYKYNTERFVQRLFMLMEKSGIQLSFKNIIQNMNTESFEQLSVNLVKQEKQTKAEHLHNLEIANSSGKITENASARFTSIAESELGTIFDDNGIDIYTALKENAIILFILNPLIYFELSPMMGKLILIDATKTVSKLYGNNDKRIFFIFDEINSYASKTLVNLINKSRSANVTVIPATQSLADLEAVAGESFREQIIENCNNYIVLRQNSSKGAELWAKIIGTVPTLEITHQIGDNDSKDTTATGRGSAKQVREFIYHPDEIKSLRTGNAIYVSRDEATHTRVNINKPF